MLAHFVRHKSMEDDTLSPPSPFYWIGTMVALATAGLLFVIVAVGLL